MNDYTDPFPGSYDSHTIAESGKIDQDCGVATFNIPIPASTTTTAASATKTSAPTTLPTILAPIYSTGDQLKKNDVKSKATAMRKSAMSQKWN